MSAFESLVLGLVQGLTEFLPVSSSGHLVIAQTLFGLEDQLAFDIFVHGATMLATVVYFRGQLLALVAGRSIGYVAKLAVGTVPAVIVGLGFREAVERSFDAPMLNAVTLAITGTALLSLGWIATGRRRSDPEPPEPVGPAEPSWATAWWVGVAQAISILPGISRSGATIVTAMWLGMSPAAAAEFSFLLGVPAIVGAIVLQAATLGEPLGEAFEPVFWIGAVAAFLSGLLAIHLTFRFLARGEFRWFGIYCWAVAIAFGAWVWAR